MAIDTERGHRPVQTTSPKTLYMNAYVSKTVENLEPGYVDETELAELLEACGPYVDALDCERLRVPIRRRFTDFDESTDEIVCDPVHVDLEFVLRRLDKVKTVRLVYSAKKTAKDEQRTRDAFRLFNTRILCDCW